MADDDMELTLKLNELDKQAEERCNKLKKVIDDHIEEMKNQFTRDTMLLPEKILSMPLKQFLKQYKGDLSSVVPKVRRSSTRIRNSSVSKYTTPSKSIWGVEETPTRRRSLRLQTPSTVRRRRHGEVTYSQNGSPLEDDGSIRMPNAKAKLFVLLDESDAAHMNLLIKDSKTNKETQIDVSNKEDLLKLKKQGKQVEAKLMVQEYKKKMQAYCDEIMAKLENVDV